jgi:hypothetical protein
MKAEDLYHTGIVVDDVDSALQWLTEMAGYQWCHPIAIEQTVTTPRGQVAIPLRIVYSQSEPRLEIIQAIPDTVWSADTSGIHHLGYWSDDVEADVGLLCAGGMRVEVTSDAPDGLPLWAYCKGPTGPRIELVSRSMQPPMEQWFATGGFAIPAG